MGLQIYANLDAVDLQFGRVQSTTDLRPKEFKQFPVADSTTIDLYLTGQDGLLNIQDYLEVQLGVGEIGARPSAGTWKMLVGAETPIAFDASATALESVISSDINPCAVSLLAPYVYKVKFDSVGLQTLPSVDATDLTPNSSANISTFVIGDATTREEWLIRVFQNPLALTNSWTNTSDGGLRGNLSLGTAGIYELLGSNSSVESTLELELKDVYGNITTVFQVPIRITNEVIGQGATGVAAFGSYATTVELDAVAATAAADTAAALETTIHNTDAVIICNQGDNIQDKWDEAAALTPNGNPLSPTNLASLIVMSGTYGNLFTPSDNYINIVGIGSPTIGDISINGASSGNYATIEGLEIVGYEDAGNYGTIKNIIVGSMHIFVENAGYIQNVKAEQLDFETNNGIIDNCESNSTVTRAFGGFIGNINNGTIKNCTAKAASSFGMQGADGVTENCTGADQAFIGDSSQVDGNIIEGTYRNCRGGNRSFFGQNTSTSFIKEARTNYINCTAAVNSFCFVNTVGAETHFSGTAINCTSGNNGFCRAVDGNTRILAGAIIENCTGGSNSFASTITSTNEGTILRCRTAATGAGAFKAIGTGKVRLCLDGNYNIVNIPATAWPT